MDFTVLNKGYTYNEYRTSIHTTFLTFHSHPTQSVMVNLARSLHRKVLLNGRQNCKLLTKCCNYQKNPYTDLQWLLRIKIEVTELDYKFAQKYFHCPTWYIISQDRMDHSAWQADISLLNRLPFSSGSKNADETCSKMLQLQEVLYLPKDDSESFYLGLPNI